VNSGPLSSTIARGKPRALLMRSSTRTTRSPGIVRPTSIGGASRVKSSTTFGAHERMHREFK
jgi:hypothetical protein